jgi:hypothetical protein
MREVPSPDFILDDGSHIMSHQITSFETLFPWLKDGGVYACEDTHTSIWGGWGGGGWNATDTWLHYSKQFTEWVFDDWPRMTKRTRLPTQEFTGVHYYDGIVFLEKQRDRSNRGQCDSGDLQ